MTGKYLYAVNALLELPAHGKYAGGRGHVNGHINSDQPFTEHGLRDAIAKHEAAKKGCDPNGITFVEFTFTDLSA